MQLGNATPLLNPQDFRFPKSDYPIYLRQLWRRYGARALVRQFRKHTRRPFSRGLIRKHAPQGIGIEIGVGFFTIAPLRRTLLTDGFSHHAGDASLAQVFCSASKIPTEADVFEFVLSEHVLEHLANPLAALLEWKRVLKVGGKVFLFLPHPERTFDRYRPVTTLTHLLDDLESNRPDTDATHVGEWKREVLDRGLAPHYKATAAESHPELGWIHHHVFTPASVEEMLKHLGFKVLEVHAEVSDRPDSFVVVASK